MVVVQWSEWSILVLEIWSLNPNLMRLLAHQIHN